MKINLLKIFQKFGFMVTIINGGLCGLTAQMNPIVQVIKVISKNLKNGQKPFPIPGEIRYSIGLLWK